MVDCAQSGGGIEVEGIVTTRLVRLEHAED